MLCDLDILSLIIQNKRSCVICVKQVTGSY